VLLILTGSILATVLTEVLLLAGIHSIIMGQKPEPVFIKPGEKRILMDKIFELP
jgi:hypothetical protein